MKMLFFSADGVEVEQVSREFQQAGIACEIRNSSANNHHISNDTELWIRDDRDCHRALMLCVQRNMGFARRPVRVYEEEEEMPAPDLPERLCG